MTDPNKAAVTESNAEFVKRIGSTDPGRLYSHDVQRLLALAEERVMIEDGELELSYVPAKWIAGKGTIGEIDQDLSTAIRSVISKIGEGK